MRRPQSEILLERSICRAVVKAILAAGYSVSVHDGEEFSIRRSKNLYKIMQQVWATDEDCIVAVDDAGEKVGWVQLIYGNGADLISDYTPNLEEALKPALARAERKT